MVPEKTVVKFGGITIFDCGVGATYDSEALVQVMRQKDIVIDIELNMATLTLPYGHATFLTNT